ncbi:MAG: MoxR family ATPase [Litorilinea sp.]
MNANNTQPADTQPADTRIVQETAARITEQVARVIVGKETTVETLLIALFCEGHILLEDVPGIGKTTLAKTLARTLNCSFNRLQFTPDLLPSDITGVNIFNQKVDDFEFRAGPIMVQLLLADEINRAGPRTQSALLEAMEERQTTVDGVTYKLPYPFLVLATQNPIELEGTFPLPEAQVDRFLMKLRMGYPTRDEERQILRRFYATSPLNDLEPVVNTEELKAACAVCRQVYLHPAVEDYLLDIAAASRVHPELELGISPRGTLALYRTCQARAAIQGRSYVTPDDVQALAEPVLGHRLVLSADARLHGQTVDGVLQSLLDSVAVPVEEVWSSNNGRAR